MRWRNGFLAGELQAGAVGNDAFGLGNGLDLRIGAEVQAFGADNLDIRDAEEAEHGAQVAFLVVHHGRGAGAIMAAAGGDDDHLLALGKAFRAFGGIAERFAGDGDSAASAGRNVFSDSRGYSCMAGGRRTMKQLSKRAPCWSRPWGIVWRGECPVKIISALLLTVLLASASTRTINGAQAVYDITTVDPEAVRDVQRLVAKVNADAGKV